MYLKEVKIGEVTLKNNILLAPMAGITDLPFRMICKKFKVGLTCTEMVSSKGIFYHDNKTNLLLNMQGEERPIAVQIFGSDIEAMKQAAIEVEKKADIIDINMGCPAPKIVKNGDGSKLLLDLKLATKLAKTVVENVKKPVTVKIRTGWDINNIVAVELAKMLEDVGISAITVHGRTKTQYYTGQVDLEIIKKVKQAVNIPVIGNGDIISRQKAKEMFEKTGVDGIMIGRGAMGKPWIFKQILEDNDNEPSTKEKLDIILEHIELEIKEKGEITGIREMRKHLCAYIKNIKNASNLRQIINHTESKKELEEILKKAYQENN